MFYRLIAFLALNFTALAIGGSFTSKGVNSDWYTLLNKAPWTPPGWVFGAAWTTIMICFSIYMMYIWQLNKDPKKWMVLFVVQWILNVSWNPIFFYYQNILAGLICISLLTVTVGSFLLIYKQHLKLKSILILPYFIWLIIASSLNAYIYFNN